MGATLLMGGALVVAVLLLLAVERQRTLRHEKVVEERLGALEGCATGNHGAIQQVQGDVDILWGEAFPEEAPAEGHAEEVHAKEVPMVPPVRVEPWPAPAFIMGMGPRMSEAPTYATLPEHVTADGWSREHDGAAA